MDVCAQRFVGTNEPMYSRMDREKIVEDSLLKIYNHKSTINRQFFKGCLPKILRGPFLNTLIQM